MRSTENRSEPNVARKMKGREKCSRKGTVKFTLVTSNLLTITLTAVRTPASQEPVRLHERRKRLVMKSPWRQNTL